MFVVFLQYVLCVVFAVRCMLLCSLYVLYLLNVFYVLYDVYVLYGVYQVCCMCLVRRICCMCHTLPTYTWTYVLVCRTVAWYT